MGLLLQRLGRCVLRDAHGGDTDADLDFDCSWSGASTDSALWDCKFLPGVLGFRCVSKQLNQEFGHTIVVDAMAIEGGLDFQRDIVDAKTSGDDGVGCSGNATDGYDCRSTARLVPATAPPTGPSTGPARSATVT